MNEQQMANAVESALAPKNGGLTPHLVGVLARPWLRCKLTALSFTRSSRAAPINQ